MFLFFVVDYLFLVFVLYSACIFIGMGHLSKKLVIRISRRHLDVIINECLDVRIARFHNIFGPLGTFSGGREKAPAAIARKVAQAKDGDTIEVLGTGEQTRSFLYIDECLEGIERLMNSDVKIPLNIGSAEIVTINELTLMTIAISGKKLAIKNIDGPVGVNGRCSDNNLIQQRLGWQPNFPLRKGINILYKWVHSKLS